MDLPLRRSPGHARTPLAGGQARRRWYARPGTLTAILALVAIPVGVTIARASEPTVSIVVNSAAWSNLNDANPGNGTCADSQGRCTLRAAVSEANATPLSAGRVVITVSPEIGADAPQVMTGWPSGLTAANGMRMVTTSNTSFRSSGILFNLTRPNVTIDLDDRLLPDASPGDHGEHTLFHVGADNVELLNISQALSSGTSFAVGPNVQNTLIDGTNNGRRSEARTANWGPERFVIIREGAGDVTVRGYDISGFYDDQVRAGLFMFEARTGTLANQIPIRDVLIHDINVINPAGTGACSGSNGSGCRARLTSFVGTSPTNADRLRIENLTFRDIFVQGMNNHSTTTAGSNLGRLSQILDFTTGWNGTSADSNAPTIVNLTIEDSVFANNAGQPQLHRAVIALPPGGRLQGTTIIRNNLFSTTTSGRAAISIPSAPTGNQGANSAAASQVFVYDNHFDGFNHAGGVVHGWRAGTVTMERNTFSRGGGAGTTAGEETAAGTTGGGMIRNRDNTANQKVLTWFPTGTATVLTGTPPEGLVELELSERFQAADQPSCALTLAVQAPTTAAAGHSLPGSPVTLDVFWTASNRAELHIGRLQGLTEATAQILIDLPVGTVDLPGANLPAWIDPIAATTAVLSDPDTGAVNGFLRIQTHVEAGSQARSSQLSRTVPLTGNCAPHLTIDHGPTQLDPTLVRYLDFLVTSSVPLRELPPEAIVLTGHATPNTIDPARINPRVVEITPLPGNDGKYGQEFLVRVAVDDSARVTANIPADAVQAEGGLRNPQPATAINNEITFINPIQASPARFSLITGQVVPQSDPEEKSTVPYRLHIRPAAPIPVSDLFFTSTTAQPAGTPALVLSTISPVITGGTLASADILVRAEAGFVPAATEAWIHHTVASGDPNYDGLVVPS
ncbi:MAG: hypothetical protein FWG11_08200, partial [Promicromonosporaceae bacterium]|nr:hypothetical protein [Promicromonosporaceae bacterium]